MWRHPATQANLATLRARGVQVIGPNDGPLAEGESGPGGWPNPHEIVAALGVGAMSASLAGLRLLVSAGPTYEDIDPVRFLGNRSSGKMGFAIAAVAAERGAEVTLVAGPCIWPRRRRDPHRRAQRGADARCRDGAPRNGGCRPCDAYIGAAAVADFTPRAASATTS
jgi:phosphopantothenoylcysteine decarboxylase/phosphopantothenate--cysteine ligase